MPSNSPEHARDLSDAEFAELRAHFSDAEFAELGFANVVICGSGGRTWKFAPG